ncbi:hypothetical protein LPUS_09493 [Lasallia pustulata]|uniref:Uncharacterized protein n=1 Tax=Lasallia pustulata TaxID=136370 RepID=A0A1W5D7Q7_9LECA|nr:hypothetical protein LPUS_09493 [Lasallia pustulata]
MKEKIIDECRKRVEEKYLQYCDMNVPIFWVKEICRSYPENDSSLLLLKPSSSLTF